MESDSRHQRRGSPSIRDNAMPPRAGDIAQAPLEAVTQTQVAAGHGGRCCGLDEVGRGALAGPLVAAAVVLPDDIADHLGALRRFLRDSKTVPAPRREELAARLRQCAVALEVVEIPVAAINRHGIGWANREAFRRLIARLAADEYIVDGRVRPPAPARRAGRVRCLVNADALVPAVSAASIIAKVRRDTLMRALAERYPHYGWAHNVGYGTAAHLAALRLHGPVAEHRTQFVATALGHAAAPTDDGRGGQHVEQAYLLGETISSV